MLVYAADLEYSRLRGKLKSAGILRLAPAEPDSHTELNEAATTYRKLLVKHHDSASARKKGRTRRMAIQRLNSL